MNPARTVQLGRRGPEVTQLGLGTAPLGGLYDAVSDDQAVRVVEQAWAAGLRFFDTAPLYGHGAAERRLGSVLRHRPRDEFVLATKVGRLLRPDAPLPSGPGDDGEPLYHGDRTVNPVFDFSYEGVHRSLGESLERLGLDRVDIVHIHDPDDHLEEAVDGALRALVELREQGVIRAVGAGMNQWEALLRLAEEGGFDCFLLAGRYTLLDQSAFAELLPVCSRRGIAVLAGGVYNSGILADPSDGARFDYRPAGPRLLRTARRIQEVCVRHGVPLRAAAIQFPLHHPAVAAVLTGVRSTSEFEDNLAMFRHDVPDDLWRELIAEGLLRPEVPLPPRQ